MQFIKRACFQTPSYLYFIVFVFLEISGAPDGWERVCSRDSSFPEPDASEVLGIVSTGLGWNDRRLCSGVGSQTLEGSCRPLGDQLQEGQSRGTRGPDGVSVVERPPLVGGTRSPLFGWGGKGFFDLGVEGSWTRRLV